MRGRKPSKLLGDAAPREFGEWIDGFILDENGAGSRSPLKSVVWVAKTIVERWANDASTTYLFGKFLANDGSTIWPNAGLIVTKTMDPFFWDACGLNLCVAPLDQVIPTIVPGLCFATYIQQHCRKCQQDFTCSDTNTHCQVPVGSPVQVQTALDGLLVIPPPDTCVAKVSRSPRSCSSCRSARNLEQPTVTVGPLPDIIHVRCTNQNDTTPPIWEAVTRTLRLQQKETFDLVPWWDGLNRLLLCSSLVTSSLALIPSQHALHKCPGVPHLEHLKTCFSTSFEPRILRFFCLPGGRRVVGGRTESSSDQEAAGSSSSESSEGGE